MSTTIEFIKACSIEGHSIALPSRDHYDLAPDDYTKFKKVITGIGGRYVTGKNRFDFDFDPTELLTRLCSGENYQQALQFFPTPEKVVALMQDQISPKGRGSRWLEPSAGRGALIKAIRDAHPHPDIKIDACEIDPINRALLERDGINLIGEDFLELHTRPGEKYDGIVMNPPFNKDQYIRHITRAYDHLKPGGALIFIAPSGWQEPRNGMEQDFYDMVTPFAFEIMTLPRGAFRESGTGVETVLVGMHRPGYDYNYTYSASLNTEKPEKRKEPHWAESIEEEALEEVREYFEHIDNRQLADLDLFAVRTAAANLGFSASEDFCQPILQALSEPAPVQLQLDTTPKKPEFDFGF